MMKMFFLIGTMFWLAVAPIGSEPERAVSIAPEPIILIDGCYLYCLKYKEDELFWACYDGCTHVSM